MMCPAFHTGHAPANVLHSHQYMIINIFCGACYQAKSFSLIHAFRTTLNLMMQYEQR